MEIISARYTQSGSIAAIIDGEELIIPDDMENRHRIALDDWGGAIEPYVAPEPSTNPADYPLLPWQFKAMVMFLDKAQEVTDAINQIEDPLTRAASLSRYLNASSYEFNDPLMQSAREAVGMSIEDLTAAWMLAKDLRSI